MTKTVSSTENPALVQTLVQKAFEQQDTPQYKAVITPPSDTFVELPCGYITPAGEILKSAEVRELTGRDEEAIAKIDSLGKALNVMLSRGVVKVGNLEATEEVLDNLLAGDRDMLLLAIYRATFGDSAKVNVWCSNCNTSHLVSFEVPGDRQELGNASGGSALVLSKLLHLPEDVAPGGQGPDHHPSGGRPRLPQVQRERLGP